MLLLMITSILLLAILNQEQLCDLIVDELCITSFSQIPHCFLNPKIID